MRSGNADSQDRRDDPRAGGRARVRRRREVRWARRGARVPLGAHREAPPQQRRRVPRYGADVHHRADAHRRQNQRQDVAGRLDRGHRGREVDRAVRAHAVSGRGRRGDPDCVSEGAVGAA